MRDTHQRFGERGGRGQADGDAIRRRDAFGSEPASALPIAEHDGVSVASSWSDEARRGRNTPYGERARDPRDPDGRHPQRRGPDDDCGARAPRIGNDGGDDDGDGDGGGPARGGGRVACLRPGPGARDDGGASGSPSPMQGDRGSQTAPAGSSLPAAEDALHQVPTDAEAQGDDGDAPHGDMDQEGAGSWGWGWWNASSWQSGSSGSGWWNQAGWDDNADDAWPQWNRNRRAPRSSVGYGGADRSRPKPAHTTAALQRNLTREEWIEELIADPPSPPTQSSGVPGHGKGGCAASSSPTASRGTPKFRAKQERANINMEARGATRDFDSRGGRSAAMDPSTARPGGQKRQERSRDHGDDRGTPVARGGDSGAAAARGSNKQFDGEMEADFGGDDEEATPMDDPGASIVATGAEEHPAADGPTASRSPGTDPTTTKQDACAGEAGDRPSGADDHLAHGLPASGAGESTGSGPGQAGGLSESPSRRASPGPIAPSHRARDAMANRDVRLGNSPDNDGNVGVVPPHARRRS